MASDFILLSFVKFQGLYLELTLWCVGAATSLSIWSDELSYQPQFMWGWSWECVLMWSSVWLVYANYILPTLQPHFAPAKVIRKVTSKHQSCVHFFLRNKTQTKWTSGQIESTQTVQPKHFFFFLTASLLLFCLAGLSFPCFLIVPTLDW